MTWLKNNLFLGGLIFATTLMVGVEGWLLWRTRGEVSHALISLDEKKRERADLQQRVPPPTGETARMLADDLASAAGRLAGMRAAISKTMALDRASASAKPIDAYFEIARFVETQRAAAKRLAIAIRPDEHFGFSSYASEGPDAQILSTVLHQRVAVEKLIDALFTAGPVALMGVQRERPVAVLSSTTPAGNRREKNVRAKPETRPDVSADFFDPVKSRSLRASGKIETSAFRLEFSGHTVALRNFMNALAGSELPFSVRSLEVEPLADLSRTSTASGISSAAIPIVTNSTSRFRVTVELLAAVGETEGMVR